MYQNSLSLERLIDKAQQHLEGLGYCRCTRKVYRRAWRALLRWAQEHGVQTMTLDITAQFLASYGIPPGKPPKPLSCYQRDIRASIRALEDFALYGYWKRRHPLTSRASFPPAFEVAAEAFLEYRKVNCGLALKTLQLTKHHLLLFTSFLESCSITKWTDIRPENIPAFFTAQKQMQPVTLADTASTIRKFLRYLWFQKILPRDLSPYIPPFKVQQHHRIPSVWRREDVEAILSAIDRSSPLGKRDYAILILVIRLGLRAGEVRTLKLEHIRWEKAEVEIFQSKTGNTLVLPLSEEIGQALIDYIRNGRPPVPYRETFVRHNAPFEPFSQNCRFHHIVTSHRRRAHIPAEKIPRRRGLHSLRHTLATRLLEQGTPMETIAAILGHKSMESTLIYTKVNLEDLRSAALDPEEVCHE